MSLVDPETTYRLYSPEDNAVFGTYTGKTLLEKGITITLADQYSAKVLGIEQVK
jgi:hypothetical protein